MVMEVACATRLPYIQLSGINTFYFVFYLLGGDVTVSSFHHSLPCLPRLQTDSEGITQKRR